MQDKLADCCLTHNNITKSNALISGALLFLGWNGRRILEAIALQSERKLCSFYLLQKFKI